MALARLVVAGMTLLVGVAGVAEPAAPEDEQERRSYALGMAAGHRLRSQSVEIDPDLYLQGMKDALSGGKTRLSEAEARAALHRLQLEVRQKNRPAAHEAPRSPATAVGVEVSFKLDPRVTKSLYMGDRWLSGPTFSSSTAAEGEAITVEARARRVGGGRAAEARPTWIASDPGMVTISPGRGEAVKLTVLRPGESTVTVKLGEVSSTYSVKTVSEARGWRADLAKLPPPQVPAGVTAAAAGSPANRPER